MTSNQKRGVLYVGTSGVVVPVGKQALPPAFADKSRLNYYSTVFNSVEINSTFKKTPRPVTIEKWVNDVTDHFRFTVKVSREITHAKPLIVNIDSIDELVKGICNFGLKQGCLLIQFPRSVTVERMNEVQEILQQFEHSGKEHRWRKAVEFRHESWNNQSVVEMLVGCNASLVLHDMPLSCSLHLKFNASFYYFRFHGPKGDYRGGYDTDFLQRQANRFIDLLNNGNDVYAYFNNTMGDAFHNALTLQSLSR